MRLNATTRRLEVVGIDNDHAFADALVRTRDGHTLNVRHVLYFLPHARQRLDATARSKFLTHTPEELVLRWLEALHRCNVELLALRDEGVLSRLDCAEMHLPIALRPGEAERLLRRLHALRRTLLADATLTPHALLTQLQPALATVIERLLTRTRTDRPDQGYAVYAHYT